MVGRLSLDGFSLPAGVRIVNLSPLKSDANFKKIKSATGESLAQIQAHRTECILSTFDQFQPDIVVIELFPFGRKKFAFELVPLLARIRLNGRRTKAVCSLRDILITREQSARYEARVCSLLNRYFDMVLVHADPAFHRLEESFVTVNNIEPPIRYTGYVAQFTQTDEPDAETPNSVESTDKEGSNWRQVFLKPRLTCLRMESLMDFCID